MYLGYIFLEIQELNLCFTNELPPLCKYNYTPLIYLTDQHVNPQEFTSKTLRQLSLPNKTPVCTKQLTLKSPSLQLSILNPPVHKQLCHDAASPVIEQFEFLCGWRRAVRVLICLCTVFITAAVTSVIIPCGEAARERSSPRGSVENMYNS